MNKVRSKRSRNRYTKRSRNRFSKRRYSKNKSSKRNFSRKKYSKKRYSKKKYSKKRYSKKRYSKKGGQRGGSANGNGGGGGENPVEGAAPADDMPVDGGAAAAALPAGAAAPLAPVAVDPAAAVAAALATADEAEGEFTALRTRVEELREENERIKQDADEAARIAEGRIRELEAAAAEDAGNADALASEREKVRRLEAELVEAQAAAAAGGGGADDDSAPARAKVREIEAELAAIKGDADKALADADNARDARNQLNASQTALKRMATPQMIEQLNEGNGGDEIPTRIANLYAQIVAEREASVAATAAADASAPALDRFRELEASLPEAQAAVEIAVAPGLAGKVTELEAQITAAREASIDSDRQLEQFRELIKDIFRHLSQITGDYRLQDGIDIERLQLDGRDLAFEPIHQLLQRVFTYVEGMGKLLRITGSDPILDEGIMDSFLESQKIVQGNSKRISDPEVIGRRSSIDEVNDEIGRKLHLTFNAEGITFSEEKFQEVLAEEDGHQFDSLTASGIFTHEHYVMNELNSKMDQFFPEPPQRTRAITARVDQTLEMAKGLSSTVGQLYKELTARSGGLRSVLRYTGEFDGYLAEVKGALDIYKQLFTLKRELNNREVRTDEQTQALEAQKTDLEGQLGDKNGLKYLLYKLEEEREKVLDSWGEEVEAQRAVRTCEMRILALIGRANITEEFIRQAQACRESMNQILSMAAHHLQQNAGELLQSAFQTGRRNFNYNSALGNFRLEVGDSDDASYADNLASGIWNLELQEEYKAKLQERIEKAIGKPDETNQLRQIQGEVERRLTDYYKGSEANLEFPAPSGDEEAYLAKVDNLRKNVMKLPPTESSEYNMKLLRKYQGELTMTIGDEPFMRLTAGVLSNNKEAIKELYKQIGLAKFKNLHTVEIARLRETAKSEIKIPGQRMARKRYMNNPTGIIHKMEERTEELKAAAEAAQAELEDIDRQIGEMRTAIDEAEVDMSAEEGMLRELEEQRGRIIRGNPPVENISIFEEFLSHIGESKGSVEPISGELEALSDINFKLKLFEGDVNDVKLTPVGVPYPKADEHVEDTLETVKGSEALAEKMPIEETGVSSESVGMSEALAEKMPIEETGGSDGSSDRHAGAVKYW